MVAHHHFERLGGVVDEKTLIECSIRQVFRDLPPISDFDLISQYSKKQDAGQLLEVPPLSYFRNSSRYESLNCLDWVDEDAIYRMSGYARWFFSPTFMIMALHNIERYEFSYLLDIFKYSDTILNNAKALDSDWKLRTDYDVMALRPELYWSSMKLEDYLPDTEPDTSGLSILHFAVATIYFSPIEKKVVAKFLRWLLNYWPDEPGVLLSLKYFWEVESNSSK